MLLALCFALPVFGADPAPATPPDDPVIAEVEGMDIHASEFAAAAKKKKPVDGKAHTEAERMAIVDQLVAQRLLVAEARKSPEVLDDKKVQQALVQALIAKDIAADVAKPTEAQLMQFYEGNRAMFMTPEQSRVSRILVKAGGKVTAQAAKAEAEKLRAAVAKDPKTNFAATAKKSSHDTYADEGGDMGLVAKNDKKIDSAIRKAAFAQKPGTVSEVFMTKEGANIVWVQSRRQPTQKTFEQADKEVAKAYRQDAVAKATAARVESLKKTAKIKIDDKAVAAVALPEKGAKKDAGSTSAPVDDDGDDGDDE
ncbi:MAG: peptidyl-prolyl cis-trans isomerase [Deltaproteobacteria bacterium]|nr:peptidyl-prolyl cis-trans isomerase [Deltaproteobacteria bacterium]